jgi:hypothetical protein
MGAAIRLRTVAPVPSAHVAPDVAVAYVDEHHAVQEPVLALDHRRAGGEADVGNLREGNLRA